MVFLKSRIWREVSSCGSSSWNSPSLRKNQRSHSNKVEKDTLRKCVCVREFVRVCERVCVCKCRWAREREMRERRLWHCFFLPFALFWKVRVSEKTDDGEEWRSLLGNPQTPTCPSLSLSFSHSSLYLLKVVHHLSLSLSLSLSPTLSHATTKTIWNGASNICPLPSLSSLPLPLYLVASK